MSWLPRETAQEAYDRQRYQDKLDDAKKDLKQSGNAKIKNDDVRNNIEVEYKTYNAYLKANSKEPLPNKRRMLDLDSGIPYDLEQVVYQAYCANFFFNQVFDIELSIEEAGSIASLSFEEWCGIGNSSLDKKIQDFKKASLIIHQSFNLTQKQVNEAIEILNTLGSDIPYELERTAYVKSNFKRNQKRKALLEAFSDIFTQINNKIIIDKVCDTFLV